MSLAKNSLKCISNHFGKRKKNVGHALLIKWGKCFEKNSSSLLLHAKLECLSLKCLFSTFYFCRIITFLCFTQMYDKLKSVFMD